jgi:hypothetical protein
MSGRWWDGESIRYQTPFELDPSELGLRKGNEIAYLFDFGEEWRLLLEVVDHWQAGEESYPMLVVKAPGVPLPQCHPQRERVNVRSRCPEERGNSGYPVGGY